MKSKKLGSLICLILVLSVFIPAIAHAHAEKPVRVPVIIGFKGATDLDLITAFDGKIKHVYTIIPAIAIDLPEEAVSRIAKAKGVAYVEPDYVVEALGEILPWGVDRIDADVVHKYPNMGTGIYVAVLDTGIDYTHPDLDANYAGGYDFANNDIDPIDDNGHGTHCAGIVAAIDNDIGVIGVAPEAKIYAVKVLDSQGSGFYSAVIAGIEWAVKGDDNLEGTGDDARVISMSFGGGSGSTALHDALYAAYGKGIILVAAAGNGGDGDPYNEDPWSYPAAYDFVIAVGATDEGDSLASFSTSAGYLELSAPGVNIYSTMPTYEVTLTSSGPPPFRYSNNYDDMSGTSMACPHVSGTVALVLYSPVDTAYDNNTNGEWDPDEVRAKLCGTAEDLGNNGLDKGYGHGLVDAEAAASKPDVHDDVHDVAVTDILAPSSVIKGDTATIDVTIENQGTYDETFNVVLTDETDTVKIGNQSIILSAGSSTIVNFSFDTSDAKIGDHTLTATAGPLAEEADTTDNSKSTVVSVESATIDIAITAVSAPNSVLEGEVVDVSVRVENVGNQNVTSEINVDLTGDKVGPIDNGTIIGGLAIGASTTLTFSWNTSGATIGDHILTASQDFADDDSVNDDKSITVTVTEQGATMHVGDLDGVKELKGKSGRWKVFVTVTIHDDSHNLLSDASVTGEWSGATTGTISGTTGSDGTVTFSTGNLSGGGSVIFTVTDVKHSSLTYDATQNHDPDGDSDGTQITV